MLDAQLYTLSDNLFCDAGTGEDKDCIHLFGNGPEIRIADIALISGNAWVHSIHLVTVFLEFLVREITAGITFIRNPNHGHFLLGKKVIYEIIEFFHQISPYNKNRSRRAPI